MTSTLRVLILEDHEPDAELMLAALREAGFDPDGPRVETEADYLARLDPRLELILADYSLPQFDAPRALTHLQARHFDIPFIVVTGSISEEAAVACMKRGAADYLLKDRLARLGPAVQHALDARRLRDARAGAEAALRESEARFRSAFEDAGVGMALQALDGRYLRVNRALCEMLGYAAEELLGRTFAEVTHPEDRDVDRDRDRRLLAGDIRAHQAEKRYLHKQGHPVHALVSVSLVRPSDGQPAYFVVQTQDISGRKSAEEAQARLQAKSCGARSSAPWGSSWPGSPTS